MCVLMAGSCCVAETSTTLQRKNPPIVNKLNKQANSNNKNDMLVFWPKKKFLTHLGPSLHPVLELAISPRISGFLGWEMVFIKQHQGARCSQCISISRSYQLAEIRSIRDFILLCSSNLRLFSQNIVFNSYLNQFSSLHTQLGNVIITH